MDIIKAIGDNKMKKIIAILLVLIMVSGVVFAEEPKKEEAKEAEKAENVVELPKYSTADKVAITVFTAITGTVIALVVKELVVDGAYGVRE